MTATKPDPLIATIEETLGHRFVRPARIAEAMTHRSFSATGADNETLEFLGDAVLALAISDLLMRSHPAAREGTLSKMRAALVNARVLADKARSLGLGQWLRIGKGEERSGGRDKESILACAYEALLGAVYADAGYEAARRVVEAHFAADVAGDLAEQLQDHKTQLQELTQRLFREAPTYTLVDESGPDHAKRFVTELRVAGRVYGQGVGHSKKTAEQAAALEALDALRLERPEQGS
jgi:ribonuclease III